MDEEKVESIGSDFRVDKLFDDLWKVIEDNHGLTYAATLGTLDMVKDRLIRELNGDYDYRD